MLTEKQLRLAERIGNMIREEYAEEIKDPHRMDEIATLRSKVLIWLGFWRDKIPAKSVSDLQDILGV